MNDSHISDPPVKNPPSENTAPQGHVMGFVDAEAQVRDIQDILLSHGFPEHRMVILQGPTGLEEFQSMIENHQWGEAAEKFLKSGPDEFEAGRVMFRVEAHSTKEVDLLISLLKPLGIHKLYHFGTLIDTQYTA